VKRRRYEITPIKCLGCGAVHELASNAFGMNAPAPGAAIMCIRCGIFNVLGDDLQARAPTAEEFMDIMKDDRAQKLAYAHAKIVLGGGSNERF